MKAIILALITCIPVSYVKSQDVMIRRNGTEIKGRVTEVGIDKVTYKLNDVSNTANFVIRKSELKQIEFENGKTILMSTRPSPPRPKLPTVNMDEAFGKNVFRFSPFKVLDSGPGIELSYEILVDKGQRFGIVLPVSLIFPDSHPIGFEGGNIGNKYWYAAPGLKIYPFGQRKVTYAVGPSVFTGFGRIDRYESSYDPATNTYTGKEIVRDNFRMGVIVNNYVNFQITQQFLIGLNGGLGSRYVDRETNNGIIHRGNVQVTGEFNFNLGFRF